MLYVIRDDYCHQQMFENYEYHAPSKFSPLIGDTLSSVLNYTHFIVSGNSKSHFSLVDRALISCPHTAHPGERGLIYSSILPTLLKAYNTCLDPGWSMGFRVGSILSEISGFAVG